MVESVVARAKIVGGDVVRYARGWMLLEDAASVDEVGKCGGGACVRYVKISGKGCAAERVCCCFLGGAVPKVGRMRAGRRRQVQAGGRQVQASGGGCHPVRQSEE